MRLLKKSNVRVSIFFKYRQPAGSVDTFASVGPAQNGTVNKIYFCLVGIINHATLSHSHRSADKLAERRMQQLCPTPNKNPSIHQVGKVIVETIFLKIKKVYGKQSV